MIKKKIGEVVEFRNVNRTYVIESDELDFDVVTEEYFETGSVSLIGDGIYKEISTYCRDCEVGLFFDDDAQVFYCPKCNNEYEQPELS